MRRGVFWTASLVILSSAPFVRAEPEPKPVTDVRVERDMVYGRGGDVDLQLDLAVPKEGAGPFPGIVCIHGGGWRQGKRQDLSATIEALARQGFVAATVSYRLAPEARFPAQIEDCKAAVRWLRANADKYRLNAKRIGVMGFSAGGHLCCLLGTAGEASELEGTGGNPDQSSRVQAVVSFFGPTDLTDRTWSKEVEENILVPFLGATIDEKPELYKKVSPVSYVSKNAPPFLFFHGTEDKLVGIRHSKVLAEKLKALGVDCKLVEMEGEGHGWRGEKMRQSIEQTLAFFEEYLKR